MKTSYTVSINIPRSPDAVFNILTHQACRYWPEDMEGTATALNDEFIFRTGCDHYSKNKVIEFIPGKKLVWLVTDSIRRTDNFSWTGTQLVFELRPEDDGTKLTFTYNGYVLENEIERLAGLCELVIKERLYAILVNDSITVSVATPVAQGVVFDALLKVKRWWGFDDLKGPTAALNDVFTIHHPGMHYSKQQITEFIPAKRLVFLVTESRLDWLSVPDEWTGTRMVFELFPGWMHFSHEGLTPDKECYERVNEGWHTIITDHFLNTL